MNKYSLGKFDLDKTLYSGQSFCYEKNEDLSYYVYALSDVVKVWQDQDEVFILTDEQNIGKWNRYFAKGEDQEEIFREISTKDDFLYKAYLKSKGLRILRQDFFEVILCFITSQNNNIKRIKGLLKKLRENFGKKVYYDSKYHFCFPTLDELRGIDEKTLQDFGFGYRAKYIESVVEYLTENRSFLSEVKNMNFDDAFIKLQELSGIGPKVSACICLYGLHFNGAFPIDTWIKKVLKEHYPFIKNQQQALEYFGENAGFAQQFMFEYFR